MFEVRFVMIFKNGSHLEDVCEDLNENIGTVIGVENLMVDDDTFKLVFIASNIEGFIMAKNMYNCVPSQYSDYVLVPMVSLEEKMKVLRATKKR